VSSSLRAKRPPRWWPAGLAWALWALAMLGIAAGLWWDHLLRQAGRTDLVQANGNVLAWLLAGMSAPTVGAVLAARRPRHPVGWLLLGLGASLGLTFLTDGYALYGLLARPGSLPAARWPAIYGPAVAVAGITCLGFVLLLTIAGWGRPATSSTVGAMSMTWWNWVRTSPLAWIPRGQWTMVPLRVPPQWEATCLVHQDRQVSEGVEEPADMVVGVLQEPGVDLHLPGQHRLEVGGHVVPGRDLGRPDGQLGVLGDDAQLLLAGEGLLPQGVPGLVEAALVPG
jgi:hypothetical protein